ncbi:MAG: DUF4231 domain-containing protein [Solirubrobacteraceae bacterium]
MNQLERVWAEQSRWSQVANQFKHTLEQRRLLMLGLTIIGAIASAAAVLAALTTTAGRALAGLSAFAVAAGGVVRATTGKDAIRNWTRARSVSEGIKSEVYTFISQVDRDAPDRDTAFVDRIDAIVAGAADLVRYRDRVTPVQRPLPTVNDVESYIRERIQRQIEGYYRPRALELDSRITLFRRLEIGLGLLGALLAASAAATGTNSLGIWVPVVTTVLTAVTAHAAAERWEYQLVEYLRTAAELERLRDRRGSAAQLSDKELVQKAEQVISIQNEGWMAKLESDDSPAGRGGGAGDGAA